MPHLEVSCRDSILSLTLATPYSTLGSGVIEELREVLLRERESDNCRVVLLSGSGSRFFSPGFDLNEVVRLDRRQMAALMRQFVGVLLQLRVYPKPTVALLNGDALAGGALLATACDFRVSGPDVSIGMTDLARDVLIPHESLRILREVIGNQRAREVALLGRRFPAAEARKMGWLDEVVEVERLDEVARWLAGELMESQPIVTRLLKQGLRDDELSGEISEAHLEFFLDCWFSEPTQRRLRATLEMLRSRRAL